MILEPIVIGIVLVKIKEIAFGMRVVPSVGKAEVATVWLNLAAWSRAIEAYAGIWSSRSYSSKAIWIIPFSSSGSTRTNLIDVGLTRGLYSNLHYFSLLSLPLDRPVTHGTGINLGTSGTCSSA